MLFDFFGRRNCGCGCGDALVPTPYDTAVPSPLIPAAVTPDCACGNGGSTCGNGCACNIPCRCACPPDMPPAALMFGSGTGTAVQLTADASGSTNTVIVGMNGSVTKYTPFASQITLTPAEQAAAFLLPAPVCLKYFTASLVLSAQPAASSAAVYAALLAAPVGSDVFSLVPGSTITLASGVTSALPVGSTLTGAARLCRTVCGKLAVALFAYDVSPATVTGYVQGSAFIRAGC